MKSAVLWSLPVALCLAPGLASATPEVPEAPAGGFTEEESAALLKGRSVRRLLEDHSRLVGGNSWLIISAPPADVWRALTDLQTYRRMFGFVDRIEVLRAEGQRRTVQIEEADALFTLGFGTVMLAVAVALFSKIE